MITSAVRAAQCLAREDLPVASLRNPLYVRGDVAALRDDDSPDKEQ
jgi:hypothetical protein